MQLRLEYQSLGVRKIELLYGDYLARAFTRAHIADRTLPRIAPIGIPRAVLFVCRHFHILFDQRPALLLADALDEFLKAFRALALAHIAAGDVLNNVGNVFRRHRADRETVRARIVLPLSAKHDLEMRHLAFVDRPACSVETEIGDMVLAAGIEAPRS